MLQKNPAAVALGSLGGKIGGPARARKLTSQQRSEIARHAAQMRWRAEKEKGERMLTWTKILTASEAIRPNQGAAMPFIRCTQANHDIDHCQWFRDTFFARAGWSRNIDQHETIEVPFHVTIAGENMGQQLLKVDYDPARAGNHRAPTVHILYNSSVDQKMDSVDLTDHTLTITANNGRYFLDIS